jgi:hypothetical protein
MNAQHSIAGLCGVVVSLWLAFAQRSEATLQGPLCLRTVSSTSQVQEYRLHYDVSVDGHYTIGGRAYVRTPTGLGTVTLSYPVSGGGYTIAGGYIWAGIRIFYVNDGVPSAAPFDASLFLASTASEVTEHVGTARISYDLDIIPCPVLN